MNKNGNNALLNYSNGCIYCALPSKIQQVCQYLLNMSQELGLDICTKKLHPLDTNVVCHIISFPSQKLQEITGM